MKFTIGLIACVLATLAATGAKAQGYIDDKRIVCMFNGGYHTEASQNCLTAIGQQEDMRLIRQMAQVVNTETVLKRQMEILRQSNPDMADEIIRARLQGPNLTSQEQK